MNKGNIVKVEETDLLIELNGVECSFAIEEKASFRSSSGLEMSVIKLNHIGSDEERFIVTFDFEGKKDFILCKMVISESFEDASETHPWLVTDDGSFTDVITVQEDEDSKVLVFEQVSGFGVIGDNYVQVWETEEKIVDYLTLAINYSFRSEGGGWVSFLEGRRIRESEIVYGSIQD